MFKGIDPEFKQKLKKFNEESKFFAFNYSDLEQGDYSKESKKFYIYSEELRQKLAKIIHDRQQPGENIPTPQSIFFHLPPLYKRYFPIYVWWFIFSKDSLYKMAKKGVEQEKKGFLIYDREGEQSSTLSLSFVSRSIREKEQKIEKELEGKMEQICDSILNEIGKAITETGLPLSELEINYLEILPDHCQCEVEVNLDGSLKDPALFVPHVYYCLRRNERGLIDFKNEMLKQIQQGQINFNNNINSIIQEIKVLCAEKGVLEDSFRWYEEDWKESLLHSSKISREYLQKTKNDLIKCIEVKAEFNDKKLRLQAEADKAAEKAAEWKSLLQQYDAKYHAKAKEKQKKLRRQAKTESKQLKREEEEKQQDKTEKRINQKQAEKLKKEKEERIRQQQEEQLKNQQEERERQEHQILILS